MKFILLTCISLGLNIHLSFAQDARQIVEKADEKMRGNSSVFHLQIKTIRPDWSRTMEVKGWTKGTDYSLLLITAPARDKGIAFLKRGKEVWNWYPTLERVIKLPPSMMNQSWMGTDFTNDDLVKESSLVKDYYHHLIGDTIIQNRNCYVIDLIPRPEAAVIWWKITLCIDKTDFMELHARFYDEDGSLVQIMNGYDPKLMDNRMITTRFEIIPANKKGQKTEMKYLSVKYNTEISDQFFTTESMKRTE
jgi:outer membrane lipoprotein-sorting protein